MNDIQLTHYRLARLGDECIWSNKDGREMCHLHIGNVGRVRHLLGQFADQMKGTTLHQMPMPDEATPVLLSALDVELLILGLRGWELDSAVTRQV